MAFPSRLLAIWSRVILAELAQYLLDQTLRLFENPGVVGRQRPNLSCMRLQGLHVTLQAADKGAQGGINRTGPAACETCGNGFLGIGASMEFDGKLFLDCAWQS